MRILIGPPRLLLVALDNWLSTARLPAALCRAGFEVGLLSEPGVLAAKSTFVSRHLPLSIDDLWRGRLEQMWQALEAFAPDFVVATDPQAVRLVHFLLTRRCSARLSPAMRAVLLRSVGASSTPDNYGCRTRMLRLAADAGLACPANRSVDHLRQALAFGDLKGWPVFLKRDHTFGGRGVRLCTDAAALAAAYRDFTKADVPAWSPRGLLRRGRRLMRAALGRPEPLALPVGASGTSIEAAVPGQPAFHVAVALEGRWLAGFSVEVEEFHPRPSGPSTRIRLHHDAAMDSAARKLIGALGHGGFCGLDFIRRPDGGLAFLEFNERPVTACHLGNLIGTDLCVALFSALTGRPVDAPPWKENARVALFPQDWLRDPRAASRAGLYLDIPGDDPPLLAALGASVGGVDA